MALLLTHIVLVLLSVAAILFLIKYRKVLLDETSNLSVDIQARAPKMYVYLRYSIPIIIVGFVLNISNSLLVIMLVILRDM